MLGWIFVEEYDCLRFNEIFGFIADRLINAVLIFFVLAD
jgi:hypothetical protein